MKCKYTYNNRAPNTRSLSKMTERRIENVSRVSGDVLDRKLCFSKLRCFEKSNFFFLRSEMVQYHKLFSEKICTILTDTIGSNG